MDNNPLRQYFRRPAVFIKLPSGGQGYSPDALVMPENGELPVYPMTAIDEITTRTPDALFNGSAVTELIKSCVPNIKDPWAITSVDLDSVLIAIKAASGSQDLEIESQCPNCSNEATYGVNLVQVLSQMKAGDYSQELPVNDLQVKFRPLRYKEMNEASIGQIEVQKIFASLEGMPDDDEKIKRSQTALAGITDLTMRVLSKTIEYIRTPTALVDNPDFIYDFLKNCDKNVYIVLRDHNAALRASAELKPLDVKCIECNHEYKQPFTLNPSDFFA